MRRRILSYIVIVLSVVGVSFTAVPFVGSLNPSAGAGKDLPRVDISALEAGSYISKKISSGSYNSMVLVVKDRSSKIRVFVLPSQEGRVILPDFKWYRWGGLCKDFGPEFSTGKVDFEVVIRCKDNEKSSTENQWDLDGNNLGRETEDMKSIKFSREGNEIVLYKPARR